MDTEYSSDDSLAWTNASSDSESSIDVSSNMKLNNFETESEQQIENHDDIINNSEGKKSKKKAKKRKHDEDTSDNNDYNPAKKKKIKIEPESDKEKNESDMNIAQSDSYVNLRIKQEDSQQSDEGKSKKKKKHKKDRESINDSELNGDTLNGTEINGDTTLDSTGDENTKKKKKKKKKAKHSDHEDESEITRNDSTCVVENSDDNDYTQSDEVLNDANDKTRKVIASTFIEHDPNKSKVDETNVNDISAIPSIVSKKTAKISDRLEFEDDDDIKKLESNRKNDTPLSKEVLGYLKSNPILKPMNMFTPFDIDDDDIWVVKCPPEITINDFKGVNLVLEGKSKIKVAGQTYDGTYDEIDCKQPIVTYSRKKVYLQNLSELKTITFRKRIPVPHIQDDTVAMHDHNSFIPLPDTKCRHPLFGTSYKKSIKVPKSIGERLAESFLQPEVVEEDYKKKKKKHKKEKNKVVKEEVEPSVSVKEEVESSIKKKKRKHKIKEESDVKPAKRIKLEQDPGAWESEKAIEENLFNF